MWSVHITWNCFSCAVLCFLKCSVCLPLALLHLLTAKRTGPLFKWQQYLLAPQIPKDVAPKFHFFSFLLSFFLFPFFFFFARNYCVSLYIIYSSLFTVQSVKMSNKNKYQCYSS